ncbi:NAD-dependent succinate-semialdehyde dehydrogenase [Streptomonospora sediminis]
MPEQPTVLIGGRWDTRSERFPVHNPADGGLAGTVDWTSPADAAADAATAADAAARALPDWAATPARGRADLLLAAAARMEERRGALAELLAQEAGKRLPEAAGEIGLSIEFVRWYAEEARRSGGGILPHEAAHRRHLVGRHPAGVVASLTPWNFPCSIQARKLAPALAAGCTVVARVSEKAPLAATELIRCFTDAGLPDGTVNLVHGPPREATAALLAHPAVRVASFTGSTRVGREIMHLCADRLVRPLLELGGDAPFVVLEDADVDRAVQGALLAKFRNTGQSCVAANRFIVHEKVYDAFVDGLVRGIDAMTVGNGLADPVPDLGPVIDDGHRRAIEAMTAEAVAGGAHTLTADRTGTLPEAGSYVAPALLADVPRDARLATTEIFGPVAGVVRAPDEDTALRMADDTDMGLAAYVYAGDVDRCWRAAERLHVGIVGVNEPLPNVAFAPLGGVKQSGLGREGGSAGIEEFTELRYTSLGLRP